jgi:hypothetical protein
MTRKEELKVEQESMRERILAAFADVSREGGVSWSESVVIDNYGNQQEQAEARASDHDLHWTELVDDRNWFPDPGIGGFSFVDSIGFRYYLPVAMIRCLDQADRGEDFGLSYYLTLSEGELRDWSLSKWSLLTEPQRQCVRDFLRLMVTISTEYDWGGRWWQAALDSHWESGGPSAGRRI